MLPEWYQTSVLHIVAKEGATEEQQQFLRHVFEDVMRKEVFLIWCVNDVLSQADRLGYHISEEEALWILSDVYSDAQVDDYSITQDKIDYAIEVFVDAREDSRKQEYIDNVRDV